MSVDYHNIIWMTFLPKLCLVYDAQVKRQDFPLKLILPFQPQKMRQGMKPRKNVREVKGISKEIIENDDSSDDGGTSPAASSSISKKIPKVNIMRGI